jgi:hypothetical protein
MKRSIIGLSMAALVFVVGPPLQAQDLKQKFASAKESAARNQKASARTRGLRRAS